jgi:hypothetical protein
MQIGKRIALTSILVSALLAVGKIFVGWLASSTSVVADGFESAGDVIASGLVLLGFIIAAHPADRKHPYGHGRYVVEACSLTCVDHGNDFSENRFYANRKIITTILALNRKIITTILALTVTQQLEQPVDFKQSKSEFEIYRYDAHHAFMNEARPEVYDPACAKGAWDRTLKSLKTALT